MTPIVGDLIRVLVFRGSHVGCHVLRVQGVDEKRKPENSYLLGVTRYGIEIPVALHPDPRFATVQVLSTNWAFRVFACVYVALRAAMADEVDSAAGLSGSQWTEAA